MKTAILSGFFQTHTFGYLPDVYLHFYTFYKLKGRPWKNVRVAP
jgi:hypothetical protein